jgi:hypothetical protein
MLMEVMIHGAVETAFLLEFAAAAAGDFFVDQAGVHFSVDGHLLARHRVETESCRHFGDPAGALGDDHEVHHEQDGEENEADHHIPAHQEAAEGRHHVAGGERAFIAVAEDEACGGDVQRQPQQGGQQKQLRKAGEIQRPFEE